MNARTLMIRGIIVSLMMGISLSGMPQAVLPYKNSSLPVRDRVKDLLSRMTPEEKFWQLFMIPGEIKKGEENKYRSGIFGFQVSAATGNAGAAQQILTYGTTENALSLAQKINAMQRYFIEDTRLGIPIIAFDEGLHGLVRAGATAFPQAIALAATWDTALVNTVCSAIAEEANIRGIRQILSPVINVTADVRWGRVEETYGEDPFLVSEMGVAFVSAFEKINIITTPKHFIANVGDGGRDSYPVNWNDRQLEEIYFPPFEAVFKRGGARSVMTAYNSLNGIPCSANNWLLTQKLKGEWGFTGFVISDAGAVGGANVLHFTAKDYPEASAQAVNNGLDVIFQTAYDHYKLFIPPFLNGRISTARLDDAVSRVLRAKFGLGLFEHPYVSENAAAQELNSSKHKAIAETAAMESIVLLKNEKQVLPLTKKKQTIAVIGTDATEARLGGYSGPGNGKINMLDGIRERAGKQTTILFAPGCGRTSDEWASVPAAWLSSTVNGKMLAGLRGEYFNNIGLQGAAQFERIDPEINFLWTIAAPDASVNNDFFSVRWTGKIQVPFTGQYKIGLDGNDGFRLYIDGKLIVDNWKKQTYSTQQADFFFDQQKAYDIRIEFFEPVGNARIRLICNAGVTNDWKQKIGDAAAIAAKADVAVVVVGLEEGEFRDRAFLNLPGHQEELIRAIAKSGKPTVVVIVGGSAVTMQNWLDQVPSVLDVWYPGEQGGAAVAAVLFGDYNPGGRLPVTFPVAEAQLPLVYNHQPTGRGDDYNNLSGLALFPFGFGLSYTHFDYSKLHISKRRMEKTDSTRISCIVRNEGPVAGDEVVQLYIRDLLSSVARPVMELKAFSRIHLLPGQESEVGFDLSPAMLSMISEQGKRVVEPGGFRIMVGASSRDIRLKETITVIE